MPVTKRLSASAVFRAVADPTRRAILDMLLLDGERTVGEIAERFAVSRPAVSKHLRVLRGARLVRARREGRQRFCALDPQPLRAIDAWLDGYRREWQARLARLKQYAEANDSKS